MSGEQMVALSRKHTLYEWSAQSKVDPQKDSQGFGPRGKLKNPGELNMRLRATVCLLANVGIWFCSGSVVAQEAKPARESANVLFMNGHIHTSNPKQLWAEAVAIRGGRIQDVGTNVALKRYLGAKTQVIDLAGRITLPGMILTTIRIFSGRASV